MSGQVERADLVSDPIGVDEEGHRSQQHAAVDDHPPLRQVEHSRDQFHSLFTGEDLVAILNQIPHSCSDDAADENPETGVEHEIRIDTHFGGAPLGEFDRR